MNPSFRRAATAICLCIAISAGLLAACHAGKSVKQPGAAEIRQRSSAAGFLADCVEQTEGFIASRDASDPHAAGHAYLYDNALAVLVLAEAGADWHVCKIADALVFAQSHDRTFSDGRFRNTYSAGGDPRSDAGRSFVGGKVTVRLPGFWRNGRWQEDYYTVSTSTGNMAWAILALCRAAERAPEEKRETYTRAAFRAADFVLELKDPNGGFTAGYEGWDDIQEKATYKATEHNITLIAAFRSAAAAAAAEDPEKAAAYRAAAGHAESFVRSLYDRKLHCFYTGTEADGKTVTEGVLPLDANTLAVLALGDAFEDADAVIGFVEDRMAVGAGFDFSAGDLDGIWNEGTAQMAVCYQILDKEQAFETVMQYLKTQSGDDGSLPAADRDGVSTGFWVSGSDLPWEYHNTQSLSATGWYAFAQMRLNPLAAGFAEPGLSGTD